MGIVAKSLKVTVTTAGTPVPIFTSSQAQSDVVGMVIQATSGTGTVWVGDSNVLASGGVGISLAVTGNVMLNLTANNNGMDLARIFLDASTSGNVANVLYFVRV